MKTLSLAALLINFCFLSLTPSKAEDQPFPLKAKRILFLGDSITHAGHYISIIEEQLRLQNLEVPELINLGLPSETCSGLSEPDHPFPRPDVHERIERALDKVKPDVVVACYGMNDGIYYPFSEERFGKYQAGIREITRKVKASGAKLILMTPPAFDPLPLKEKGKLLPAGAEKYAWFSIYEGYDDVMKKYAAWVMTLDDDVDMIIDLHTPVNEYVNHRRQADPQFTMSPDGVHVNEEGHAVIADAILRSWGISRSEVKDAGLSKLIHQKQMLMHNSWLSHVGHKRPGVKAGIELKEAQAKAVEFDKEIEERLIRLKPLVNQDKEEGRGTLHHLYFPASKNEAELSLAVDYYLWIPEGVEKLRGVIVHQHGCGDGASKGGATAANDLHWQELARKWDCALLGSSYEGRAGTECRLWCDPRNGSADRFVQALNDFATKTGRNEVAEVPWCLWGHSGGGYWASIMQALYPERIVAIWLQSGQAYSRWTSGEAPSLEVPKAAYKIPVVACPGFKEKDHERFQVAWNGCFAMFQEYRRHNAPFIFAPDPRTGHECGDSRYLAIPFFDACLQLRLPAAEGTSTELKDVRGFVANLDGTNVQPVKEYQGDPSDVVWLPTKEFAKPFKEFIETGAVGDMTPPPAPEGVTVQQEQDHYIIRWTAQADFESGIAAFRLTQDGKTIAQIPEKPNTRFERSLFQKMSYHDTPEQPLPELKLVVPKSKLSSQPLGIISVNSVGLQSEPTQVELP